MKLTVSELAYVRSQGLYLTEKCDGCGKLLNQALRYTITGKPEVYCSAVCRELAFFADRREAKKHASPGRCANCGAKLDGKRRGALYCDEICKKRVARQRQRRSTAEARISGTTSQPDEQLTGARIGG